MIKFGPYVIVRGLKTRELKDKNTCITCTNKMCSEYGKQMLGNYCSYCGGSLSERIVESSSKRKPCYGQDYLKNRTLFSLENRDDIFYPRKEWKKYISLEISGSCEIIFRIEELTKSIILNEIKLFEKAFRKELKELRENYDSVEIKFGIINACYDCYVR